jgi:serine/threonine protein kinase
VAETIAHYQLLDRIGTGRLGELFRARDTRHGRTVALRRIDPTLDEAEKGRLLAEAKPLADLSHPFLASLFDAGIAENQGYVATEFVAGDTLTRVVAGQPLNARRAAELAAQVADALAEVHARGFVHGDVRPENVVVTPKGQAKLLELGLSKFSASGAARAAAASGRDEPGPPHAALHYLSPEQALGEATDARTDIFSLGAVLYTMLTGKPPFDGTSATALAVAALQASPPPPSRTNPDVPHEVDAIVARAMAKSLDRRYQSAAEMAADLRAAAMLLEVRTAQDLEDAAVSMPEPSAAPWRTLGLVLVILLIVALGAWLVRGYLL